MDLGCGTGAYALWARMGCAVVGVDESAARLAKARGLLDSDGVWWAHGDLTHLPGTRASFDVGLMQVVMEVVDEPQSALHEAWRVIKPGGRLVVGLIHGTGPSGSGLGVSRGPFLDSVRINLGLEPAGVQGGLYVNPHEFLNSEQAWALKHARSRRVENAGFVAVGYGHDPQADTGREGTP